MIRKSRLMASIASLLGACSICLCANAQLSAGWSTKSDQSHSLGIAMYGVFAILTSVEEENPGRARSVIRDTIGIESETSAAALSEYMVKAYYAGHASSAARASEFCERDIRSREDLIEAIEAQVSDHNAELDRLAARAADVLTVDEYSKLVSYAEKQASGRTLTTFDPRAAYDSSTIDVRQEVARRCQ